MLKFLEKKFLTTKNQGGILIDLLESQLNMNISKKFMTNSQSNNLVFIYATKIIEYLHI